MILVSSCLAGENCRWDATNRLIPKFRRLVEENKAKAVCPEKLAGLSIPRKPCEIIGGDGDDVLKGKAKVIDKDGKDLTEKFIKGAKKTLEIARRLNVRQVVFKSKSPSCGKGKIYDGTFKGHLKDGNGLTTTLLLKNNIKVFTEEEYFTF